MIEIIGKNKLRIRIKYHGEVEHISKIENGDWIDLRSAENLEMKQGDFKLISLGVSIELPSGYEAIVAPRSSTFKNFGIIQTNSIGIIDESYCGDNDVWKFPALAMRDTVIRKNDRICQFRLINHQPEFKLVEVEKFNNKNRGGIGSTGTK